MITALFALCLVAQDPPPAVTPPAEPPVPSQPTPEPTLKPDVAQPDNKVEEPPKPDVPGAPATEEFEDVPPAFAAGPAAVGAGATTLGFLAGGLCPLVGCLIPFLLLVPISLFLAPCWVCFPWAGAGLGAAAGSVLGGLWEFVAGNKRPLVWARLAAPPGVGMVLMLPGVVLALVTAVAALASILFIANTSVGALAAFGFIWVGSILLGVGLLAGAAGAFATYAGLVVFDARTKE